MLKIRTLFLSVLLSCNFPNFPVSSQGVLPNGDPYFCVPPGICADSGGIEPRIQTPGDTGDNGDLGELIQQTGMNLPGIITCPSGRVPCYAQGVMSDCGLRLVRVTGDADGFSQYGAHPWQAYLMNRAGAYLGGGSLISPYHVLTATHKVLAFAQAPASLVVVLGVNDPATMNNNPPAPRSVAAQISIFNASTYNNATLKNDIAIIRLATPISLIGQNSINTICLPPITSNATTYMMRQRCLVSGYGQIQPYNLAVPTRMKQVAVNTTDIRTCANGFSGTVNVNVYLDQTGGQLCAGGEAQKDACFQDGGGPLTCGAGTGNSRFTVAGIVIWGKSCGQRGLYGVYTNVPFYRQWIIQTITQRIP